MNWRKCLQDSPNVPRSGLWLLILASLVLCHTTLVAQESAVYFLNHADTLLGKTIEGEDARELIGHVDITQGNVRMFCDRATQFLRSGIVKLDGNVVVKEDSTVLHAPRGVYHRAGRWAEGFDGVQLDDGKVRLTSRYGKYQFDSREGFFTDSVRVADSASIVLSDSLTYYRTSNRSLSTGHVHVLSPADNMEITGGRLEHDQRTQFSRMTVNPVLIQIDTSGGAIPDTLVVKSLIMEAYRDSSKRMLAIDSVHLAGREIAGLSGYAEFFSRGDSIILRRAPVVWYQDTQVSGDSLHIYLLRRKLHRVSVSGNAVAVSQSDSLHPGKYDQMIGETMHMVFEEQALRSIVVNTQAIGLYHLYDDTTANGLNKISGDKIEMKFSEKKLNSITVVGGVEGQYFPENLVFGKEEEYAIPGARWRSDRPRQLRDANGILTVQ